MWRYHDVYEPVWRPTFFDFPRDERCFDDCDEMMLGPSLLIAPVVEAGAAKRTVYLPAGADWYHYWSNTFVSGGQSVTVPAPWGKTPFFVRAGSVLPVNIAAQYFGRYADERAFEVFPLGDESGFSGELFEDDGESFAYRRDKCVNWSIHATAQGLRVSIGRDGAIRVPSQVRLIFPGVEQRPIVTADPSQVVSDIVAEGRRWVTLSLQQRP
jgi:alpha-glucosidase